MSALLGFVGDLLIDRPEPSEVFRDVTDIMAAPDLLFGNLEGVFSDDPHPAPSGGTPIYPGSHNLNAFGAAGFNVLSMANNHSVDAGHAALLENLDRLHAQGVQTCGAGRNLIEARKPAIVQAGDIKVAVLAYASVFPMGYEARSNVPGIAPMRAYDMWRTAFDNYHLPGTPPRARTVPDEGDLQALAADIAKAREQADVVVVSFHWGDFLKAYHLTDHETRTAHWCVDQGVDMIVGHHHHAVRGVEWYKGKPIFYGLGHFVFDVRLDMSEEAQAMFAKMAHGKDDYSIYPRPGWPLLPQHEDTRMTFMAWAVADASGISDVGFLPCRMRPDGRVVTVDPEEPEGVEVIDYVQRCITDQGLNAAITAEGAITIAGHRTLRGNAAALTCSRFRRRSTSPSTGPRAIRSSWTEDRS